MAETITFQYQQEATAEGFNKLLYGVIPTGIISGGELRINNQENTVYIKKFEMMINCQNNTVLHVSSDSDIEVNKNNGIYNDFIIARANWTNGSETKITYLSCAYDDLTTNDIIFGQIFMENGSVTNKFDYTVKTWSPMLHDYGEFYKYPNDNATPFFYYPSFSILTVPYSSNNQNNTSFKLTAGKAIIDGKFVEITSAQEHNLIDGDVEIINGSGSGFTYPSNNRTDLMCLNKEGTIKYIMGIDGSNDVPEIPPQTLPLAKIIFTESVNRLRGDLITQYYNSNYISPKTRNVEIKNINNGAYGLYIS